MAVPSETVALKKLSPVAGVPIDVAIGVFGADEVKVTYGRDALVAVLNTHYTVDLDDPNDFDTFSITPLAALTDAIAALILADDTEEDAIVVRRTMEFLSTATPANALHTQFVANEVDRSAARDQELAEGLSRTLQSKLSRTTAMPPVTALFTPGSVLAVSADGQSIEDGPTSTEITNAETYAEAAETARDFAHEWATEYEDVVVDDTVNPSGYSAFHWARKALAYASTASAAAIAAAASAAMINLPALAGVADAGKQLYVNAAGNGYDLALPAVTGIVPVASRAAMLALATDTVQLAYLSGEDKRDGFFDWNAADLTTTICGGVLTSSAVDSGTETITCVGHGLKQNMTVVATAAVNGAAINTIYYVIWVDVDNFRLAETFDEARAGTAFNLTGTTQMTFRRHYDPTQGLYITAADDLVGANGAWVRDLNSAGGIRRARMFGAVGGGHHDDTGVLDAAPDDTPAIQAMFYSVSGAATEQAFGFDNDIHCVSMVELFNMARVAIFFNHTSLYGKATVETDAILHVHNCSRFRIDGPHHITSDGSRTTPLYSTNYKCAVHLTSRVDGSNPETRWPIYTQANHALFWNDLTITMFKYGIVSGNHVGEADHYREAQDTIIFSETHFRSVMIPWRQSVENGGVQFIGGDSTVQQFSASSSWWVEADTVMVQNLEGRYLSVDHIYQKASSGGWSFYGKDIKAHNCSYESGAPNYVTGRVCVDMHRGFVSGLTGTAGAMWTVASGCEGPLILSGESRRISEADIVSDTPPGVDVMFVDAIDAPDCDIILHDLLLYEFYFQPATSGTRRQFVRGGKLKIGNGVIIRNTSGFLSYDFGPAARLTISTAVECEGDGMSATADLTAKVGWSVSSLTGGHFHKSTTSPPTGKNAFIAIEGVGTGGNISTATGTGGFRVRGSTDYYLTAWHKRLTGTGYMKVTAQFYDVAGTSLGSSADIWGPMSANVANEGVDGAWNRINIPFKTPAGAHFGRLILTMTNAAARVGISGL